MFCPVYFVLTFSSYRPLEEQFPWSTYDALARGLPVVILMLLHICEQTIEGIPWNKRRTAGPGVYGKNKQQRLESTSATSVPTRFDGTSAPCFLGQTNCIIKHEPLFSISIHIRKVFTQVILSLNRAHTYSRRLIHLRPLRKFGLSTSTFVSRPFDLHYNTSAKYLHTTYTISYISTKYHHNV